MAATDEPREPSASTAPPTLIRSVFFYNSHPQLHSTAGLHFFEPRYRLLVLRAMQEPQRQKSFVFLPNFEDYQASHGDIGYLATIIGHRPVPTANPNELPRADVQLRFDCRVLVLFQWVESSTSGLSECVCVPVDPRLELDEPPPPSNADLQAWQNTDWPGALPGCRVLRASTHGHPGGPAACHWLLHAHSEREAAAAATRLGEHPAGPSLARRLHTVVRPPPSELCTAASFLRRVATIHLRLAPPVAPAGISSGDFQWREHIERTTGLPLDGPPPAGADAAEAAPEDAAAAAAAFEAKVREKVFAEAKALALVADAGAESQSVRPAGRQGSPPGRCYAPRSAPRAARRLALRPREAGAARAAEGEGAPPGRGRASAPAGGRAEALAAAAARERRRRGAVRREGGAGRARQVGRGAGAAAQCAHLLFTRAPRPAELCPLPLCPSRAVGPAAGQRRSSRRRARRARCSRAWRCRWRAAARPACRWRRAPSRASAAR